MSTTLSSGATVLTPLAVIDYASDQGAGSIVHTILGRSSPDVTLRPALMRNGTLTLIYGDDALSEAARVALANGSATWRVISAERPTVNMTFVPLVVGRQLADTGEWKVTVTYQEVTP